MRWRFALVACALPALGAADELPANLVVDVRVYEARSENPDFRAMESLSFFINTDGKGVREPQWLATIARQLPAATLATLASDTAAFEGPIARFEMRKRSQAFDLRFDLSQFIERGTFEATAKGTLSRSAGSDRTFERPIELRVGQTYVFGSSDLELSPSEYLSHFRDFEDGEHRGKLYEAFRGYTFFLVVAVTPRIGESAPPAGEPEVVHLDPSALPELESPLGIPLVGEMVLGLELDGDGAPVEVQVVRSSVPELNPRVVAEAANWRFPEAAGKKVRLTLNPRAEPR